LSTVADQRPFAVAPAIAKRRRRGTRKQRQPSLKKTAPILSGGTEAARLAPGLIFAKASIPCRLMGRGLVLVSPALLRTISPWRRKRNKGAAVSSQMPSKRKHGRRSASKDRRLDIKP
jgi:hypothetical protein